MTHKNITTQNYILTYFFDLLSFVGVYLVLTHFYNIYHIHLAFND